jgi:plastocyanin
MHFTTLSLLFSAVPLALAQYGGSGDSGSSTTSSAAISQATASASTPLVVKVSNANGDLSFTPNDIQAPVGAKIEFHFYGPKHSVAQSSFAKPCVPLNSSAFFSGPITTTGTTANTEIFTLTVNSTAAIWFYCSVASHCAAGMSGVINAP